MGKGKEITMGIKTIIGLTIVVFAVVMYGYMRLDIYLTNKQCKTYKEYRQHGCVIGVRRNNRRHHYSPMKGGRQCKTQSR